MPSATDKKLTRSSIQGGQTTAAGIGQQGADIAGQAFKWAMPGIARQSDVANTMVDPQAAQRNREAFASSMDMTKGMISGIAARPGGYSPGEVSQMKLSAASPIAGAYRTAAATMADRASRTGNAAQIPAVTNMLARQRGQDVSGAMAGVDTNAAEARRQDTLANTGMALGAQMQIPGMYQHQQGQEADMAKMLEFAPQMLSGLTGTGLQTQLGASGQNVDYSQLLEQISTQPGFWSKLAAGLAGGASSAAGAYAGGVAARK